MVDKRGQPSDSFGQGRQPLKKHKPNNSHNGRSQRPGSSPNKLPASSNGRSHPPHDKPLKHDKTNPVLKEIADLPDPKDCAPCRILASEMQTSMIGLLDQLVSEEAQDRGSTDILHHARALKDLLRSRATSANPSEERLRLDKERPETQPLVQIPPYIERKLKAAADLPPLPEVGDPHLLECVFTHSSANDSRRIAIKGHRADEINYERLEFLGDAYIEVVASRLIYSRFPHLEPSQQSHFREELVMNATLAAFSQAYDLGARLKHGGHTRDSKNWSKVLADVFEAYVAAIILSDPQNGYTTVENWLTELWTPRLLNHHFRPVESPQARDEINKLLAGGPAKLEYREEKPMVSVNGLQHYSMGLYLTGWGFDNEWLGSGEGQNKKQACIFAATDALTNRQDIIMRANAEKLKMFPPKNDAPKPGGLSKTVEELVKETVERKAKEAEVKEAAKEKEEREEQDERKRSNTKLARF